MAEFRNRRVATRRTVAVGYTVDERRSGWSDRCVRRTCIDLSGTASVSSGVHPGIGRSCEHGSPLIVGRISGILGLEKIPLYCPTCPPAAGQLGFCGECCITAGNAPPPADRHDASGAVLRSPTSQRDRGVGQPGEIAPLARPDARGRLDG